jgi:hypothetical protein
LAIAGVESSIAASVVDLVVLGVLILSEIGDGRGVTE